MRRNSRRTIAAAVLLAGTVVLPQCYVLRGNSGGGRPGGLRERDLDPRAILVPAGYRVELVAHGLTCPTGLAFDGSGTPCVVESGFSPPGHRHTPRLLRLSADGEHTVLAEGRTDDGPWNGVAFAGGAFWIAEAGSATGGRILRVDGDGTVRAVVDDLPGYGDHSINGPVVGPRGTVFFGIGTATNSGVVGADSLHFGWLRRHPDFHDIPGADIVLTGQNFTTPDLLGDRGDVDTGAFVPFGTPTEAGQRIRGRVPCTGGVHEITADGRIELVAWGFRNPYGLAFAPDGRLFVTDNGYDERGSRPVWGAGDLLWQVERGTWYGWPDYSGDRPLTDDEFDPPAGAEPAFLLAEHPNTPPRPIAVLGVHSSANGFDFSTNPQFGHVGEAFLALFGDQTPTTGDLLAPTGFKVVRVDVATGVVREFAANDGSSAGPASKNGGRGLERPIAVRFDPTGAALYVVDFGILTEPDSGSAPEPGTGCVWRIARESGTTPLRSPP